MLQIIRNEFFRCEFCHSYYTDDNYPVSLNCEKNICKQCIKEAIDSKNPCPFDESHHHLFEEIKKNILLANIIDDVNKLIRINKQDQKYDRRLMIFIEDLKLKKEKLNMRKKLNNK